MRLPILLSALLLSGCTPPRSHPPTRYIQNESFRQWLGKTVVGVQVHSGTDMTIFFKDAPPMVLHSYKYSMRLK